MESTVTSSGGPSILIPDIPASSNTKISDPKATSSSSTHITLSSEDPINSCDPYVYLSSSNFHRTFTCHRTNSRVSFSDCGEKTGPLVFYVPPSGCSRWVGILIDGYAKKKGIRIVTPDRPGQGATPRVALEDRIDIAREQAISLLEYIEADEVTFMTHSAGLYFIIPLIISIVSAKPTPLFKMSPRVFLCSPFVPTSISGQKYFPLLPTTLVKHGHALFPKLQPALDGLMSSLEAIKSGWRMSLSLSGYDMSPESVENLAKREAKDAQLRAESQRTLPTADIHPPFVSHRKAKLSSKETVTWLLENDQRAKKLSIAKNLGTDTLFEYMLEEGLCGMSQEHLLSLGRAKDGGARKLVERVVDGWKQVGYEWLAMQSSSSENEGVPSKLTVVIYWANGDAMIPLKGRVWLDNLLSSIPGIEYLRHELGATSGHDSPLDTEEVVAEIFDWVLSHNSA